MVVGTHEAIAYWHFVAVSLAQVAPALAHVPGPSFGSHGVAPCGTVPPQLIGGAGLAYWHFVAVSLAQVAPALAHVPGPSFGSHGVAPCGKVPPHDAGGPSVHALRQLGSVPYAPPVAGLHCLVLVLQLYLVLGGPSHLRFAGRSALHALSFPPRHCHTPTFVSPQLFSALLQLLPIPGTLDGRDALHPPLH